MNKNFLIGLAAVAAAGYYFLMGKKQAIENLLIKPIDIGINASKTNLLKLTFNLKLKITNPSNFSVKVNKIDVDIVVNNSIISEFQKSLPILIAPNKTEIVTIEITAQNAAIITTIIDIITSGEKITAGIKGIISTDLGDVNISYLKSI